MQVARGDLPAARATLARLEELRQQGRMHADFWIAFERARVLLWAAEQNRAELESWANTYSLERVPGFRFRNEALHILLSRAWLALERREEAAALLTRLAAEAEAGGREGSRVEILALLAVAHGGQLEPACSALAVVLRLAEPEGYTRLFLDLGEPMHRLLRTWLKQTARQHSSGMQEGYARRLLSAFDGIEPAKSTPPTGQTAGLVEPLSPRELEVLALAAQGLTNQQIAAQLVISIRTVKKHIENINSKLGAQNRTQAAARARELGILTQTS